MGRASRGKRERRQDAHGEELRRAGKADRRGLRVGRGATAHVDAVTRRGPDGLAEALIARHNRRMANLEGTARELSPTVLAALNPLFAMDYAAWSLGLRESRHPCDYGDSWLAHLGWATDSAAIAARYLLCGQLVAASVVARSQLERWTQNVAVNDELPQQKGESTAEWIDRLMSSAASAERIVSRATTSPQGATEDSAGPEVSEAVDVGRIGQDFADMSELLHGRGPLLPYLHWEAQDLLEPRSRPLEPTLERLLKPLRIALRRVRAGLATAALDRGNTRLANLLARVVEARDDGLVMQNVHALLFPLEPMALSSPAIDSASGELAARYRSHVEGRHAPETPAEILPALAFAERRHRALRFSRKALEQEAEHLGTQFDDRKIADTLTEMVLAAECSASLASWVEPEPPSVPDAFVTASSALRSTVWMWLEDDDRAMGCGRTVLEMIARLRTWRLKPQRAQRLTADPRTTPRDCMEAAGWRRLSLLNGALGDLAHSPQRASIARDVLVMLQLDSGSNMASKTGRTNVVNMLIFLLQAECGRWVDEVDSSLGEAYWEVVRLDRETVDQSLEPTMRRAWKGRTK